MKNLLQHLIQEGLSALSLPFDVIDISIPHDKKFGDFSSNIAFTAAKQLHLSPLDAAKKITDHLPIHPDIDHVDVVPPGFINFFLTDRAVRKLFDAPVSALTIGNGKTVVTDSSNPNVAKPFGIHHLLSTVIGDSINRILSYAGYHVVKDNFIGDIGTQFGKLIYAYKTWGKQEVVEKNPISELLKLYVHFHDEAEKDPTLEDHGREEFKKLEQGDPINKQLWKWFVDLSMKEFERTYQRLHISFDVIHGESFYEDKIADIIMRGKEKNIFVQGEGGALVAHFEDLPSCVIVKSDGSSTYHLRDLARIAYWDKTYHPSFMIDVVDVAQELHFKQLFALAEKLELTTATNIHVSFGRMSFKDRKMSTRKGNIIYLEEVLDEAVKRTRALLQEKGIQFPEEEQQQLADMIAIGAIKYAVLCQNRNTNIVFDWDRIITLDGNSGPYLQYTYTRGKSILTKAGDWKKGEKEEYIPLEELERDLMLKCLQFHDVVLQSVEELKPNIVANYIYELAQLFNSFYHKLPVLSAEEEKRKLRLKIVERSCTILQTGLELLGINVPDRM
jgi:arginyl-tRNA synthetase